MLNLPEDCSLAVAEAMLKHIQFMARLIIHLDDTCDPAENAYFDYLKDWYEPAYKEVREAVARIRLDDQIRYEEKREAERLANLPPPRSTKAIQKDINAIHRKCRQIMSRPATSRAQATTRSANASKASVGLDRLYEELERARLQAENG